MDVGLLSKSMTFPWSSIMFQFDIPAAIRTPPVEEFVSVDSLLYTLRWWVGPTVCCNEQARYCPSLWVSEHPLSRTRYSASFFKKFKLRKLKTSADQGALPLVLWVKTLEQNKRMKNVSITSFRPSHKKVVYSGNLKSGFIKKKNLFLGCSLNKTRWEHLGPHWFATS